MMLTDYFYGFIEDNAGFFALPKLISGLNGCTDFVGYPTGICQNLFQNNQPFIFIPAYLLAKLVTPVLAYNLIILGGLALNFLFSLRFFKKLFGRFIGLLLAGTFVFSPYLAYQSRSHFDLVQVWPVIWFFHTLFFSKSRHKPIYLGLLLALTTGISNYLGYLTGLAATLYLGFCFLTTNGKQAVLKTSLPKFFKAFAVFLLTIIFFIFPYIRANYLSPKVQTENAMNSKTVNRPFEDFVIFSSRPWYYLLPSVDNPLFGKTSQKVLDRFSGTNNYLTQNYFKAEHSASFLGWTTIFFALVGIIGYKVRGYGGFVTGPNHTLLATLPTMLTVLGLVILTMPPSFSVNGLAIYTPSYLLFKAFPMFRVLLRMGIIIMFFTLIFTGYGYKILTDALLKKNLGLATIRSFLALLALFSVVQLYIPPKITHVGTPPKVYSYLGQTDSFKSPIVVYPYSKTNEALFWLTTHQKALINPRFYSNKETNFISEDFTNLLDTTRGLEQARNLGAKYLIYFYEADQKESADFFGSSLLLNQLDSFNELGGGELVIAPRPDYPTLVRLEEAGPAKENSAILYRFR